MKMPPCKGCSERRVEPNCHGTCERFAEWTQENEAAKARRREDNAKYEINRDREKRLGKLLGWKRDGQR